MSVDLALKYDLRVPRYTSYPTAPHFVPDFDEATVKDWMSALPPEQPVSLYLHIPYCDEMCWFCGCYTKITKKYEPVAEYTDVLLREIDNLAGFLPARMKLSHVHFGGGSPTLLSGEDFARIMAAIRARFDLTDDAEIAVEMDPRDTTEAYVAALAEAGVNRASIGVQDFHENVQKAINRIQPFEVTKQVIDWLRAHGVTRINMDLMYGLPYQTDDHVRDMVERAVTLAPDRIAFFGYAHVPWMKAHMRLIPEDALPDTETRWRQAEDSCRLLEELGYVKVGLDHFARPEDPMAIAAQKGRLRRNFQGYTTDEADVLLGVGASAISRFSQGFTQNVLPLHEHADRVAAGRLTVGKGYAYTGDDLFRAEIISQLMCNLRVDMAALYAAYGRSRADVADAFERLAPLTADGIAVIDGDVISVPDAHRPLLRLVAAAFDAYLDRGAKRHSKAV